MINLYGCSDHNCLYGHKGGMGTNGGCRCEKDLQRMGGDGIKACRQIRLLRAEVERLREDAERYRWLRDHYPYAAHIAMTNTARGTRILIEDAAIDAAMREGE